MRLASRASEEGWALLHGNYARDKTRADAVRSLAEDNAPGEWCAHCLCLEKRQSLIAKGWEGKEEKAMRAELKVEERPFL